MPWGETIADFVRARQARRSSERDAMWQKLMDIASTGSDIWKTISGREYATGERKAAEDNARYERLAAAAQAASEAAKARGEAGNQRLYAQAFEASQAENAAANALKMQEAADRAALQREQVRAGTATSEKKEKIKQELAKYLAQDMVAVRPDLYVSDEMGNLALDREKNAEIKKQVLAYYSDITDPDLLKWLNGYLDTTLATIATPAGKKVAQNPVYNPPAEPKPTKPQYTEITDLAKKLNQAMKASRGDPDVMRELNYILDEMPRASNPKGGLQYSRNPIEWTAKAMETVNRILGITQPQSQFNPSKFRSR